MRHIQGGQGRSICVPMKKIRHSHREIIKQRTKRTITTPTVFISARGPLIYVNPTPRTPWPRYKHAFFLSFIFSPKVRCKGEEPITFCTFVRLEGFPYMHIATPSRPPAYWHRFHRPKTIRDFFAWLPVVNKSHYELICNFNRLTSQATNLNRLGQAERYERVLGETANSREVQSHDPPHSGPIDATKTHYNPFTITSKVKLRIQMRNSFDCGIYTPFNFAVLLFN